MTTRVITDTSFAGEEGMVKVWNHCPGVVEVSDEGHLLDSQIAAWVDDNDTVRHMIDMNQLTLMEGTPTKVAKKNLKQKSKESEASAETAPMSEEVSDHLLAAPEHSEESSSSVFTLDDSKML